MNDSQKKYVRNQKIYKKYIGQFEKIEKIELWMFKYHNLITKIANKDKIENIKTSAEEINLKFDYKGYQQWDINIIELDEIFKDFFQQIAIMCENEYFDFLIMENDKLALCNIIEVYFETLKNFHINNKFLKLSKKKLNHLIPKSKTVKFINKFINNTLPNIGYILFVFTAILVLAILYLKPLEIIVNSILPLVVRYLFNIPQEYMNLTANTLVYVILLISLVLSMFTVMLILKITKRFWINFLPELEFAFERDLEEKKTFLSNISIAISIVTLIITILTVIYNK